MRIYFQTKSKGRAGISRFKTYYTDKYTTFTALKKRLAGGFYGVPVWMKKENQLDDETRKRLEQTAEEF